jgi:hypothetical protein
MFSGGEKKSFYELSFVIGSGIIALNLKNWKLVSCESIFSHMYANTGKKFIFSVICGLLYPVLSYGPHRQFRGNISIIGR